MRDILLLSWIDKGYEPKFLFLHLGLYEENGAAVNVDADDAAAYKYWSESEEKSRQGECRVCVSPRSVSASYALTQRCA